MDGERCKRRWILPLPEQQRTARSGSAHKGRGKEDAHAITSDATHSHTPRCAVRLENDAQALSSAVRGGTVRVRAVQAVREGKHAWKRPERISKWKRTRQFIHRACLPGCRCSAPSLPVPLCACKFPRSHLRQFDAGHSGTSTLQPAVSWHIRSEHQPTQMRACLLC